MRTTILLNFFLKVINVLNDMWRNDGGRVVPFKYYYANISGMWPTKLRMKSIDIKRQLS